MADAIKLKISSAVAEFVRSGVTVDKKLAGIQTAPLLEPFDQVTLLFCLMKDADPVVKEAAGTAFAVLPGEVALSFIQASDAHPSIVNELARFYSGNPEVTNALLGTELLSTQARAFLQRQQLPVRAEDSPALQSAGERDDVQANESDSENVGLEDDETPEAAEIDVEDEQFLSKYKIAMIMGIGEKIKMALTGDKEWRAILVKDSNKLVSAGVIKNPRITDGEILTLLKVGVQNDEIIRLICANKEWIKNYMIRKALVCCHKTPLPNALRYLATLTEKDIATFAKSKNISSVLSTQAKRILLSKKR